MPQPTRDALLKLFETAEEPLTKRDLARLLNLKGDERRVLSHLLTDLTGSGLITRTARGAFVRAGAAGEVPAVAVFVVRDITVDGDAFAEPIEDEDLRTLVGDRFPIQSKTGTACAVGDRILVTMETRHNGSLHGKMMRVLGPLIVKTVIGRALKTKKGWVIEPVNRSDRDVYALPDAPDDLVDGHLVEAELSRTPGKGALRGHTARVRAVIGHDSDPRAISLIAMLEKGLSPDFPDAVIAETEGMTVPTLHKRTDMRAVPLVTIDGADARDFDDAVFAEPDGEGGHHIIVAIADVSHYVRAGTALDREAFRRGNSTYFPDRVVPMLPEALSNDLCSLRPHEDRACMGFHLWIDSNGSLTRHKVFRGLMRSRARLTYEQAQAAFDGITDATTEPLRDDVLMPMKAAFECLEAARRKRGALDIDAPERRIDVDAGGTMTGVSVRVRLDAHKMIEEFMILANVAAALALEAKNAPCIYRIHDRPDGAKVASASDFLDGFGLHLAKGNIPTSTTLNALLRKVEGTDIAPMVNEIILRSQSQAVYSPDNIGHFGLALARYAHFTSPIRRYADLVVHRSLVRAYGLGEGGLTDTDSVRLDEMAAHITKTERASMEAERSAVDRFTASYLESRIAAEFTGRISGVTGFGLFVRLDQTGADGLVPIRSLPNDYYIHREEAHALVGRKSGRVFRLCAPVRVRVREADRLTGSILFELVGVEQGADIPGYAAGDMTPMRTPGRSDRGKAAFSKKGKEQGKKKKKKTTPKHKRRKKGRVRTDDTF